MLNKSDRFKVLRFFKFCRTLGLLPVEVDLAGWELCAPSIKKQCICALSFGSVVLHVLYKNVSLAYVYFFVPDVPLHQLMIHATMAMGSFMCTFWYSVAYIRERGLFASCAKATLTGNIGGSNTDNKEQMKMSWAGRLKEYSLQDLLAISLPYMVWLGVPVIGASYVYDPSMKMLLYAALPTNLQNRATFGLLLVEEARFFITLVSIVTPIWQLQVMSFELLCRKLELLMQKIQERLQTPRNTYMTLRSLQLYISMLNNVNGSLIFTFKLASISACILSGYAAIAHFHEHPVFGVMYYFLLVDVSLIYTVVYEKAFKVPQMLDKAAASAALTIRRGCTKVLKRQIRSIRCTGIRVGHFHHMERASTLIFMAYVVTNIVNMLVAFR